MQVTRLSFLKALLCSCSATLMAALATHAEPQRGLSTASLQKKGRRRRRSRVRRRARKSTPGVSKGKIAPPKGSVVVPKGKTGAPGARALKKG
jgi:hypothetical protein